MRAWRATASLAVVLLLGTTTATSTPPADPGGPFRLRAFDAAYNLDYPDAVSLFNQALAADPNNSATHRALAATTWLHIIFRRGSVTVDQYLGSMQRGDVTLDKPPAEDATSFSTHSARALQLAEANLAAHPDNVQALYDVGAAVGVIASYGATVEGRVLGSFRQARRAFDTHERVLALDPSRKDAGLIVGTYRYIVATLALPLRVMAYVAGFGGGRERGLRLIEEAAGYSGENQTDARFALVLIYNRERRYDEALAQLAILRDLYPRNRLVWLESGSTSLRAGHAAEAERFLVDGMTRFDGDRRQRMFGESALWRYKRGAARAAIGKDAEATADLRGALSLDARKWVHGRAHLELAKLALKAGNKADARQELRQAAALADSDNDPGTADEARRLMK